ncbi:MAG: hypothetical protein OXU51_24130 [Candidatus Poribacteria bacterium]|nr:hypothetical protein [Candidatus Poribacteria bacterium]
MLDWKKTFAVIVQTLNRSHFKSLLKGHANLGNNGQEFYDLAFGHAVMVLKIDDEPYYKGYRPSLTGNEELRRAFNSLYNAQRDLQITEAEFQIEKRREKIKEDFENIKEIFKGTVPAVICDERKMYRPRHERGLSKTTNANLIYRDWSCNVDEVRSTLTHVENADQGKKYYSWYPDTASKPDDAPDHAPVHNCVTWIIKTQRESMSLPLLPSVTNGSITEFAKCLRESETGDIV